VNNHYTNSIAELEHFSIGFLMACKDNNVSLVKILADTMGVQLINMQDAEGYSGLIYSCKMGNIEVVDVLLSHGANVHLKNRYSYDALMYACELENNERIVELLLSAGANVNVFNSCKMTPLCIACKIGAAKTVKLLLKHGAVVDHPHDNGYSPLFLSCINGNNDIISDLLIYGANVNRVNAHGYRYATLTHSLNQSLTVSLLVPCYSHVNADILL
jgi:ankyrin repeat protein